MTTTLNAERVEAIFEECLALPQNTQPIDGIVFTVRFNENKLAEFRDEIGAMLLELPEAFRKTGGGGWSFMNACDDRHGVQWTGFHQTMAMLFCLGQAYGFVAYLLPRELWSAMPGGMPYLVINDDLIGVAA